MREELLADFKATREKTENICSKLELEDYVIQGIPDVSPPKWHLAHTSWFFENFIIRQDFFDPSFSFLFNSYYESLGKPYPRAQRGLLSRPTVKKIYEYRNYINSKIINIIKNSSDQDFKNIYNLIYLGIQHEQQHQELLLIDIKYNFSLNLNYSYINIQDKIINNNSPELIKFIGFEGGLINIGHDQNSFCFDNERPQHKKYINNFYFAQKLVTNYDYLSFIQDKSYQKASLWLYDGWDWISRKQINCPLYWKNIDNTWMEYTLLGLRKLNLSQPVCHINYYEADAFARWAGYRLPTEEEWELVAQRNNINFKANFLEQENYHPQSAGLINNNHVQQLLGDAWEWTSSSYSAYPGYKPLKGAVGEYNGKFMNNQMVLRGGSCVTPQKHMRITYRNFFQPFKRWFFSGIRLAQDGE